MAPSQPATALKRTLPPETIETPRLELRKHGLTFARAMFDQVDADRARLRNFLPWVDESQTWRDIEAYIRMSHDKWEEYELFDYSIFRREDDAYLGNIGVHQISWDHRRCEIGYWVLGKYEGQGYVSEASRALESALFTLGFNRIEIHCSSDNGRSASVPRRNGYVLEGTQREDRIENGEYVDTLVFAKLWSDFEI